MAAAVAFSALAFGLPAEAERDWRRGSDMYQIERLQRACHWGDRRACIYLGEMIGRRRLQRDYDRYRKWDRYPRYGWQQPYRPPGFYYRFEGR
jgi:hypothetical protein